MINRRLIGLAPGSMKYIIRDVLVKWISLLANIALVFAVCDYLLRLMEKRAGLAETLITAAIIAAALVVRALCTRADVRLSFYASKTVKHNLRKLIYEKLLRLGASYSEQIPTSEVVQLSVEGADQMETYFGSFLPQLFYCILGPLTLFVIFVLIRPRTAVILLLCIPLIPIVIMVVQTIAGKIISKYWGQYAEMGNTFLENLQGLTTLKIYQADEYKHKEMNREAEGFRKATMRVLTMQLNSITIMDLVAYGGAAAGIILSVIDLANGRIDFAGCMVIILLAAEFFLPMRALGSYFHVAMNGMAASKKIFALLDLPEPETGTAVIDKADCGIKCSSVRFSYEKEREILHGISPEFPQGSFVSIVGESGCGKSTLAGVLMGSNSGYEGSVTIGGLELSDIDEKSRMENITLVSHDSYIFRGTVRDNLLLAKPDASDEELWEALGKVNLASFIRSGDGLDTKIEEEASNISGGQRQRLALARALLHDTPIYIFDEATSNIDLESEADIMAMIHELARTKTVILISHRLANVVNSDHIYVFEDGSITEHGTHDELLKKHGEYERLWKSQRELELYGLEKEAAI